MCINRAFDDDGSTQDNLGGNHNHDQRCIARGHVAHGASGISNHNNGKNDCLTACHQRNGKRLDDQTIIIACLII